MDSGSTPITGLHFFHLLLGLFLLSLLFWSCSFSIFLGILTASSVSTFLISAVDSPQESISKTMANDGVRRCADVLRCASILLFDSRLVSVSRS